MSGAARVKLTDIGQAWPGHTVALAQPIPVANVCKGLLSYEKEPASPMPYRYIGTCEDTSFIIDLRSDSGSVCYPVGMH